MTVRDADWLNSGSGSFHESVTSRPVLRLSGTARRTVPAVGPGDRTFAQPTRPSPSRSPSRVCFVIGAAEGSKYCAVCRVRRSRSKVGFANAESRRQTEPTRHPCTVMWEPSPPVARRPWRPEKSFRSHSVGVISGCVSTIDVAFLQRGDGCRVQPECGAADLGFCQRCQVAGRALKFSSRPRSSRNRTVCSPFRQRAITYCLSVSARMPGGVPSRAAPSRHSQGACYWSPQTEAEAL